MRARTESLELALKGLRRDDKDLAVRLTMLEDDLKVTLIKTFCEGPEEAPTSSTVTTGVSEKHRRHRCCKETAEPRRCSQCQKAVYCSDQRLRADCSRHKRTCSNKEFLELQEIAAPDW